MRLSQKIRPTKRSWLVSSLQITFLEKTRETGVIGCSRHVIFLHEFCLKCSMQFDQDHTCPISSPSNGLFKYMLRCMCIFSPQISPSRQTMYLRKRLYKLWRNTYLSWLWQKKEALTFADSPRRNYPRDFMSLIKGVPKGLCMKSGQASQPFFPRKALGVLMGLTRIPENRYFLTIVFYKRFLKLLQQLRSCCNQLPWFLFTIFVEDS